MKKLCVSLFMMVIIGVYIVSMKNVGKDTNDMSGNKDVNISQNTSARLKELGEKIKQDYPDAPKAVIQMHNEFMGIGYSSQMSKEDIPSYIEKIRPLYSEELKELNSVEVQTAEFIAEIDKNLEDSFIIISSQIGDVTIIKDSDEEEPKIAEVMVKHSSNQGDLVRTYRLVKENEQWKINSWENLNSETADLED